MDEQTDNPITRCPQRIVQVGGIKTKRNMRDLAFFTKMDTPLYACFM